MRSSDEDNSLFNGTVTAVVYSLIFWALTTACDIISTIFFGTSGFVLQWVSAVIPVVFVCLYTVIEKKFNRGRLAVYNIGFFMGSFLSAVFLYFLLRWFIVPLIVAFYYEIVDYGDTMFSGLAKNLEGLQFAIYYVFYCLGMAAALVIRGIVYLIEKHRRKNMY
ncbi:MAG: hypothetical protein ACI4JW_04495 [Oscillospiraceae bacterium]